MSCFWDYRLPTVERLCIECACELKSQPLASLNRFAAVLDANSSGGEETRVGPRNLSFDARSGSVERGCLGFWNTPT